MISRKKRALWIARKKADGGSLSDADQAAMMPESYANPAVKSIADSLMTLPQRAIQNSQYSLDTGNYDPAPTLEAATLPMGTGAIAGVPVRAGEAIMGAGPIRAYHGSPHDFDAFSLDKIGTGEGAQAYGHGLYFAEHEPVAQAYKKQLSGQPMLEGGVDPFKEMPWMGRTQKDLASWQIKNAIESGMSGDEAVLLAADKLNKMGHGISDDFKRQPYYDAANALMSLRGKKWESSPGKMYEVNINADPEHFLDWDKPVSEQPHVLGALKKMGVNTDAFNLERSTPGQIVLDRVANEHLPLGQATDANISAALRESGIPGVKYLDQGSRGAGEGSRNYVVFDDKTIDILRKYGLAGLPAAGVAASNLQGDDHMKRGGAAKMAMRVTKADGGGVFSGYIPGTTGGRTDNKPISVDDGSYVIPADILSGLGEGNSHAGWAALCNEFGMASAKADGGSVGQPVPIIAASGEAVIPAAKVAEIGGGNLDEGHGILDALVKHVRAKTIKKLKSIPGPKRN